MIRKTGLLFFVVILLAGICIPAAAQMTDDAVIEYVKEGMANGKSQNDLLKELMASGVTMEQAQRIKKMVESENQGTNLMIGRVDEMDRRRRNAPGVVQLPTDQMLEQAYSNLKNNQVIQVGIKIPILDWGKGRGKVKMAQSNYEVVESRIKQETMNFNQNIFILVEQFNNQKAQLENAGTANRIAQKRYDTNIETFLIGRISTLDLNDSQSKKDYAKQNYINELFYYWYYYYQLRSITLWDFANNCDINADIERIVR